MSSWTPQAQRRWERLPADVQHLVKLVARENVATVAGHTSGVKGEGWSGAELLGAPLSESPS